MEKVKVTRKYQVTIAKQVREKACVKVGDELLVGGSGRRILLGKPIDLEELAGSWTHIERTEDFMAEARKLWRSWRVKRYLTRT